jgi:hypothetical protein
VICELLSAQDLGNMFKYNSNFWHYFQKDRKRLQYLQNYSKIRIYRRCCRLLRMLPSEPVLPREPLPEPVLLPELLQELRRLLSLLL